MRQLTQSGRKNLAACIAMVILTGVMMLVRFAIRLSHRQRPIGPDWLCLLSTVLFQVYCGLMMHFILATSLYGALDVELSRGPVELTNVLKVCYETEILFGCVITSTKLSILWFYHQLFTTGSPTLSKRVIQGTAALCVIWFIVATFLIVFQCNPIHAFWDKWAQPPYCMNSSKLLLAYELTNLFLDVAILVIPVPIVWNLRLPSSKKLGVLGIFMLGFCVCLTSILRLTAIYQNPDPEPHLDFVNAFMWSILQLGIAIICACLPILGPLLPVGKLRPYIRRWNLWPRSASRFGSREYTGKVANRYKVPSEDIQPHLFRSGEDRLSHNASQSWVPGNVSDRDWDYNTTVTLPMTILVKRDAPAA